MEGLPAAHQAATVIIATLTSTIINCFGSAHGLFERLQQKKKDNAQDAEIKKLRDEIEKKDKTVQDVKRSKSASGRSERSGSPAGSDDLDLSLRRSGRMIQSAYNADFDRLGKRFAMGDGNMAPGTRARMDIC